MHVPHTNNGQHLTSDGRAYDDLHVALTYLSQSVECATNYVQQQKCPYEEPSSERVEWRLVTLVPVLQA